VYTTMKEAFVGLTAVQVAEPDPSRRPAYLDAYGRWEEELKKILQ